MSTHKKKSTVGDRWVCRLLGHDLYIDAAAVALATNTLLCKRCGKRVRP